MKTQKGFTFIEILFAMVVLVLLMAGFYTYLFPVIHYFQQSPVRQQANVELRMGMEMIETALSNGKANTIVVSTPATVPTIQFSSATFQGADGSFYSIFWSNQPKNSLHFQRTPPGGVTSDTVLSTHVTNLSFGMNAYEFGIIEVTLEVTFPLDATGQPGSFLAVGLPARLVHMLPS